MLRTVSDGGYLLHCPGCNQRHRVGPGWSFNDDYDAPTFRPSILVTGVQPLTDAEYDRAMGGEAIEPRPLVCHSFVTDGQIQFLDDCTHALAGRTVPLGPSEGESP
ncbi:DUF6527 family protein [Aureimonas sp. AU40]|uniref:DUF6527 family protein n=1 Tax=Aureimonas sp. AU40 TaxID=1637747 RepID=UPI001FCCD839|nr:DUF6527 family protein [Aureimonas sp. AU40]